MKQKNYERTLERIAKLMKYILAHRPDEFGLVLDEQGFVFLKDLIQAINEEKDWSFVRISHIMDIVNFFERKEFEIKDNKIRAINPQYALFPENNPPKILYAAIRRKTYPHILEHGFIPTKYPFFPLSVNKELAMRIGKRRDQKPVLVEVQANKAAKEGITFYCLNEFLYLIKELPSKYIIGPPLEKVSIKAKKTMPSIPISTQPLILTPEMFQLEKIKRAKQYARKKARRKK
ncbi:MAG TPA: hypothetical protein ENG63_10160 [Candidatus Desulfofervidus auxilii]|uniref:RNA 2'-phosphotransferase n=1 Tax=Desulfofervidus auxilii TaxID=1621989 RepID=A0A7C0U4J6_DESA2|nr:hypothetical protein [Candidatus Desulfofervidus auxilii]